MLFFSYVSCFNIFIEFIIAITSTFSSLKLELSFRKPAKTRPPHLGIILDSNLTFNEHVNTLTSSLISTLCQISKIRHLFSKSVLVIILNCLVFSKLFYCSTVWSGTLKQNIHKLQLVQNFAARVLTNTWKFDHISPVLRELGWSSIKHLLLVRDVT